MCKKMVARLCVLLVLALLASGPLMAQELSSLFWDDQIPYEMRLGVTRGVGAKIGEWSKEKNEQDKPFVHAYPTGYIQIVDGKPVTWVTLQRCLEEKMITERWRFVLEQKSADARDYEVVDEEKIWEVSNRVPNRIEVASPRAIKPFEFKHDKLELTMQEGSYLVSYTGGKPDELNIVGKGRLTLDPIDNHERRFFQRALGVDRVDTEVEAIKIDFNTDDEVFMDLVGAEAKPDRGVAWTKEALENAELASGFGDLLPDVVESIRNNAYKPFGYGSLDDPLQKGSFTIVLFTKDHERLIYVYSPNAVEQIAVYHAQRAFSLDAEDQNYAFVTQYPTPELREQPYEIQERRRAMRKVMPRKYDAQLDIESEKFVATVDMELTALERTDFLGVGLAGSPKMRYIIDRDSGQELPYEPAGPGAPFFRINLPKTVQPGEKLRIAMSYDAPGLIDKVDEGLWYVGRGGFLPFHAIIQDPVFASFTVRTPEEYDHVAFGSEEGREVTGGHLYTKWVSDHTLLFPTLTVGQFFPEVQDEIDGVKIRGYATKMAVSEYQQLKNPRKGMETEVEKAKSALASYNRIYGVKYPFKELKVVSVPGQYYAQAPSGILYMGEIYLLPPAVLASFGALDPTSFSGTTAHEAGHQWWGGLVSNANNHHYWFVEGFAELGSALYEEQVRPGAFEKILSEWRENIFDSEHWCALKDDSVRWFGYDGPPAPPLRYTKGPYVFSMLGEYFGYDKLVEYMRVVMEEHSGDLITTSDLQQIAERVFGRKLDWYWEQWIRDVGIPTVSYSVDTREVGGSWKLDYKFEQEIFVNKQLEEGRYFKLIVPVAVQDESGEERIIKIPLNEPSASGSLDLPFRPRGAPEVNPGNKVLFRKQAL